MCLFVRLVVDNKGSSSIPLFKSKKVNEHFINYREGPTIIPINNILFVVNI